MLVLREREVGLLSLLLVPVPTSHAVAHDAAFVKPRVEVQGNIRRVGVMVTQVDLKPEIAQERAEQNNPLSAQLGILGLSGKI